ncbi:hypothetical protein Tdes44962_MAKER08086 [Teratosphaeria destructans]|uniref:Uncharacterized protein n=1 Tax=Teratosphaeria destructans TaxID=418781 RepID=A0A9W7SXQ3_9PEZI|nr:hypothetical protein Tdes44962_MAKER08086 [Teratosphaeria destructans]
MSSPDEQKQRDIANIPPALARERFGTRHLRPSSLILGGPRHAFHPHPTQTRLLHAALTTYGISRSSPPTAPQLQGLCGPKCMDVLRGYEPFDRTMVERVLRAVGTRVGAKGKGAFGGVAAKVLVEAVLGLETEEKEEKEGREGRMGREGTEGRVLGRKEREGRERRVWISMRILRDSRTTT